MKMEEKIKNEAYRKYIMDNMAQVAKELGKPLKPASHSEIANTIFTATGERPHENTVGHWADGISQPNLKHLRLLAQTFGLDMHEAVHRFAGLPFPMEEGQEDKKSLGRPKRAAK
jgi:hypothetical protein